MYDDDIKTTLEKLAGGSSYGRQQAYDDIKASRDPRYVDGLLALLLRAEADIQRDCIALLGLLEDAEVLPFLYDLMDDRGSLPHHLYEKQQAEIIIALGNIGDADAVPRLLRLLHSEVDKVIREHVIIALGHIGDRRAEAPLVILATDENDFVRQKVARALSGFSSVAVVTALVAMLQDEDRSVRGNAAASLGTIGNPSAIPALDVALGDESWWVRLMASQALTAFDTDAIVEPLCYALTDPNYKVRTAAAEKLGEIGGPVAYEALLNASRRYRGRHIQAALAKAAPR